MRSAIRAATKDMKTIVMGIRSQTRRAGFPSGITPASPGVVGREVIVAGAEGREDEPDGDADPWPALASVDEVNLSRREQKEESPEPGQGEWDVREHISGVRDAEPGSLVGEAVIGLRLGDRLQHEPDDDDQQGDAEQDCYARVL